MNNRTSTKLEQEIYYQSIASMGHRVIYQGDTQALFRDLSNGLDSELPLIKASVEETVKMMSEHRLRIIAGGNLTDINQIREVAKESVVIYVKSHLLYLMCQHTVPEPNAPEAEKERWYWTLASMGNRVFDSLNPENYEEVLFSGTTLIYNAALAEVTQIPQNLLLSLMKTDGSHINLDELYDAIANEIGAYTVARLIHKLSNLSTS
jgi:hypothetical protein